MPKNIPKQDVCAKFWNKTDKNIITFGFLAFTTLFTNLLKFYL